MADHPQAKTISTVGAAVLCVFVLLALSFGMGEWKSASPDTATAPAESSTR
jgi:hypothetical protein